MAQGVATKWSMPAFQVQQTTGEDLSGKEGFIVFRNSSNVIVLADAGGDDKGAFNGRGGILSSVDSSATGANCEVLIGRVWAKTEATEALDPGDRLTGSATNSRVELADGSSDIIIAFAVTGAAATANDWILIDWVGNTLQVA